MTHAALQAHLQLERTFHETGRARSGTYRRFGAHANPQFECVGRHFAALARRKRVELVGCSAAVRGLGALGAPTHMIRQLQGVLANLVKHVDMFADLSRRYGVSPERGTQQSAVRMEPGELARDNFVRGCLSGAVQAVMAEYQASEASDDAVRCAVREIASDERRHNALAWQIESWLRSLLSADALEQLGDAQRRAIAEARRQLQRPAAAELQYFAGLPPVSDALSLFDALVDQRFSDCRPEYRQHKSGDGGTADTLLVDDDVVDPHVIGEQVLLVV